MDESHHPCMAIWGTVDYWVYHIAQFLCSDGLARRELVTVATCCHCLQVNEQLGVKYEATADTVDSILAHFVQGYFYSKI